MLDLVVLTTQDNKGALDNLTWEGARSVSIYTPSEAAATLGLGSIGREDQAYCDVLHAAWFAGKNKAILPLTRSAALGSAKDDLRDLAFAAAPYAAAIAVIGLLGWTGWAGYDTYTTSQDTAAQEQKLAMLRGSLSKEQAGIGLLPYDAKRMRNVLEVNDALQAGRIDFAPAFQAVAGALQGDAVVMGLKVNGPDTASGAAAGGRNTGPAALYTISVGMRLADVITRAEEAVQVSRRIEARLNTAFGKGHTVKMTREPVAAQASVALTGNLFSSEANATESVAQPGSGRDEHFFIEFQIVRTTP